MEEAVQEKVSNFLASRLGCSNRRGRRGRLRPEIAQAIQKLSGDPDTEVVRWMAQGAPIGVSVPIKPCGIFPRTEGKEQASDEAANWYSTTSAGHIYKSALEEKVWVQAKLEELVREKCMLVFDNLEAA